MSGSVTEDPEFLGQVVSYINLIIFPFLYHIVLIHVKCGTEESLFFNFFNFLIKHSRWHRGPLGIISKQEQQMDTVSHGLYIQYYQHLRSNQSQGEIRYLQQLEKKKKKITM